MCSAETNSELACAYAHLRDTLISIPFGIYDRVTVLPMALIVLILAMATIPVMIICFPWEIIIWIGNRLSPEPKENASHAHSY